MKLFTLLIFMTLFVSSLQVYSNTTDSSHTQFPITAIYLDAGVQTPFDNLTGINLNVVSKLEWGASLGYYNYIQSAANLPSGYYSGLCIFGDCIPIDELSMYSFRIMKEFPTHTYWFRMGAEAGFSYLKFSRANFVPHHTSGWLDLSSNYTTSNKKSESIGLSLRAKIEFPLCRFVGCEFSVISNVNKYKSFAGVEFHITAGLLRGNRN